MCRVTDVSVPLVDWCQFFYLYFSETHSSQLKVQRVRLLELISNSGSSVEDVTAVFTEYLGLILGLVDNPTAGGDSKLRFLTSFKWTNTLGGRVPR